MNWFILFIFLSLASTSLCKHYDCENYRDVDQFCLLTSLPYNTASCRTSLPDDTTIQMQFITLEALPARLLYRMTNVEKLDIFDSNIKSAFLKPELQYLRMARCQLEKLEIDAAEEYHTTELHLPENQLSQFPENLSHLLNLTFLDLSHNQLPFVDMRSFKGLNKLTFLDLSYNNIKVVFATGIAQLGALQFLNLAHNDVRTLDISRLILPELADLDISRNRLKRVDNFFEQLPKIQTAQFQNNEWDCDWQDAIVEQSKNIDNSSLVFDGPNDCFESNKSRGLVQQLRREQELRNNLKTTINQIAGNMTENAVDFEDIFDNLFCRILGEE